MSEGAVLPNRQLRPIAVDCPRFSAGPSFQRTETAFAARTTEPP